MIRQQGDLLTGQQELIASQATTVGERWVVVEMTIMIHAMRFWLSLLVVSRDAFELKKGLAVAQVFHRHLQLLGFMELVPESDIDLLREEAERCENALLNAAKTSRLSAPTNKLCSSAASEQVVALLEQVNDRVIVSGSRTYAVAQSAAEFGLLVGIAAERVQAIGEAA